MTFATCLSLCKAYMNVGVERLDLGDLTPDIWPTEPPILHILHYFTPLSSYILVLFSLRARTAFGFALSYWRSWECDMTVICGSCVICDM